MGVDALPSEIEFLRRDGNICRSEVEVLGEGIKEGEVRKPKWSVISIFA